MLPDFNNLDIRNYDIPFGYYTLGILSHHRPDIEIIPIRMDADASCFVNHDLENYDWLEPCIEKALANKKIVCVVPWDEHVIFLRNIQLENILNKYTNDPVYWITNLEPNASDVYTSQHIWQNYYLFKIKIIELPWWLLNDCLGYYSIADKTIHAYDYNETNYTCMINHATLHKFELPRQLKKNNLSKCGKFTIANLYEIPVDLTDIFVESTLPAFQKYNLNYQREGAQTLINGVWISKNVENFNNIEKQIKNIPLVLNSETIMIKLFATEKSIWPILLGKLFLIHGRPNIMQYTQRFNNIDYSRYADMTFDTIDGYGIEDQMARLDCLISKNQELIKDSKDLHQELQPELEAARWTFGENMYKYFKDQVGKII